MKMEEIKNIEQKKQGIVSKTQPTIMPTIQLDNDNLAETSYQEQANNLVETLEPQ